MFSLDEEVSIQVAMTPIDMRCAIDGLTAKVVDVLSANPQTKTLFVFVNKKRDKMKALLWDKNGFILIYKRIEQHRFKFPKHYDKSQLLITHAQLKGLLAGFDFIRMQDYPELDFSYYT